MRNLKYISIFFIIITALPLFGQERVYNFPITPKSSEWKTFNTHYQKLEAVQIPEPLVKRMTTDTLIHTCLNYPLFLEVYAFNNLQDGLDKVKSGFGGLQELFNRSDTGAGLLNLYKSMNPLDFNKAWDFKRLGDFVTKFIYIEMLLSQETIIVQLTSDQRRILLKDAVEKVESKLSVPEIYGTTLFESNLALIGRILLKEEYQPFVGTVSNDNMLDEFIRTAKIIDSKMSEDIVEIAKQFLNAQ